MITRRNIMKSMAGLSLGVVLPNKIIVKKTDQNMLVHQVFFWLKNPEEDLKEVLEGCKSLGKIKSGINTLVGTPAATPKREVVDDSYHIALSVTFNSIADHDLYQTDPIHLKFIADHKSKWDRVQIYDFEVSN